MERLLVLRPNLRVARERLRLEARLERFAERLRPFEGLDDRNVGMPYTYVLENNSATLGLDADRGTII